MYVRYVSNHHHSERNVIEPRSVIVAHTYGVGKLK